MKELEKLCRAINCFNFNPLAVIPIKINTEMDIHAAKVFLMARILITIQVDTVCNGAFILQAVNKTCVIFII